MAPEQPHHSALLQHEQLLFYSIRIQLTLRFVSALYLNL